MKHINSENDGDINLLGGIGGLEKRMFAVWWLGDPGFSVQADQHLPDKISPWEGERLVAIRGGKKLIM